jgi:hypothetical protein
VTIRVQRLLKEKELRAFFAACDSREEGQEPAWEEHLRILERSKQGETHCLTAIPARPSPTEEKG